MQSTILLIIFFFLFIIIAFAFMLSGPIEPTSEKSETNRTINTEINDRQYIKQDLMTRNEIEFYKKIKDSFEIHSLELLIFPQVAMSAVIKTNVRDYKKRMQAWSKISQKRIDYGIYDESFNIVCIIELDDRTHNAEKDIERDKLTQSADIKTLRYYQHNTTAEIIADDIKQILASKET